MAEYLVMRHDATRGPDLPWLPVAIVEKTVAEGPEEAARAVAQTDRTQTRWRAVRWDDGIEIQPVGGFERVEDE
jgi:hypothetical protein